MTATLGGGRVQVVAGALRYDDGYVVGDLELHCDRHGRAAFHRLAEAYDPNLDVFAVDETGIDVDAGSPGRLQVRVQCAFEDAPRLWRLLECRLRVENGTVMSGAPPPSLASELA